MLCTDRTSLAGRNVECSPAVQNSIYRLLAAFKEDNILLLYSISQTGAKYSNSTVQYCVQYGILKRFEM